MKRSQLFLNASVIAVATRSMLEGQEHLIVPVIAAREGVMNGLLYTSEELSVFANAWNGVPVPVTHPKNGDEFISANSPDVEEKYNIGRFYNVNFDSKIAALRGEIWINIDKATKLGHTDLLTKLEAGEHVNVSTGLFSNVEDEAGEFKGDLYKGKATAIRPDHLALLPNELGACSTAKGCGTHFYANCQGSSACSGCASKAKAEQAPKGFFGNAFDFVKSALGFKVNELSHDQTREAIRMALRASLGTLDSSGPWPYILDVYDNFFVYELDNLLFKQGYAMDATEAITLAGNPLQVVIKREYVPVNPIQTNKQQEQMKPSHVAILAALVANQSITAEQRTALEGLPEGTLDVIFPEKGESTPANVVPIANTQTSSGLSDDDRKLLDKLKANEANRLGQLRTHVEKSYPNLAKDAIAVMPIESLEALASASPSGAPVVNFALAGGAPPVTNAEQPKEHTAPSILLRTGE